MKAGCVIALGALVALWSLAAFALNAAVAVFLLEVGRLPRGVGEILNWLAGVGSCVS